MITSFMSSKGSIYNIVDNTKTKRWKKQNNEGLKKTSDLTIYSEKYDASLVGSLIYFGFWIKVTSINVILLHDELEKESFDFLTEPKKEFCALEIWGDSTNPSSIHVGNVITDIW